MDKRSIQCVVFTMLGTPLNRLSVLLGITALLAQSAAADSWPRYLGPDGVPVVADADIPTEFTEADFNWEIDLPGAGHSSPVVWGDRLFLTATTDASTRKLLCYSTENGELLWEWASPFEPHHKHQLNEFASTTPCLDENHVYIFWTSGNQTSAHALTHDGELVWEREKMGTFEGDHGSASSPILVDGNLIVFWDHLTGRKTTFSALNPETGEDNWRLERRWPEERPELKTTYSTPAVLKHENGPTELIFTSMPFGVISLDASTGDQIWSYDTEFRFRTVASPVIADGVIFATWGSGNGAKDHVALIPGTNAAEPEVAWRNEKADGSPDNKGLPYVPTPLAHDGYLYMWTDSALMQCVKAENGEIVYGPERIGGGRFFSNPVLVGDRIFCGSLDGEMVVVKAGPAFEVLARNPVRAGINATPAIVDGVMYVRTNESLFSLGGK